MSKCYLCDLCDVYHRRGENNGTVYWTCEALPLTEWKNIPFAFDCGRDDPKEICRYFELKCRYFKPKVVEQ